MLYRTAQLTVLTSHHTVYRTVCVYFPTVACKHGTRVLQPTVFEHQRAEMQERRGSYLESAKFPTCFYIRQLTDLASAFKLAACSFARGCKRWPVFAGRAGAASVYGIARPDVLPIAARELLPCSSCPTDLQGVLRHAGSICQIKDHLHRAAAMQSSHARHTRPRHTQSELS
eukprot:364360-Chlamydomonas_euryale.AAC.10